MKTTLHLDTTNGHLSAFGIAIGPDTRANDLPASFAQTSQAVHVEDRLVNCVFARASDTAEEMTVELELRFEESELVSCFITLTTPQLRKLSDSDFYGSAEQRLRLHRGWLASMSIPGSSAVFPWGSVGVARDRSENVYIYVHNRNNRWAH